MTEEDEGLMRCSNNNSSHKLLDQQSLVDTSNGMAQMNNTIASNYTLQNGSHSDRVKIKENKKHSLN